MGSREGTGVSQRVSPRHGELEPYPDVVLPVVGLLELLCCIRQPLQREQEGRVSVKPCDAHAMAGPSCEQSREAPWGSLCPQPPSPLCVPSSPLHTQALQPGPHSRPPFSKRLPGRGST